MQAANGFFVPFESQAWDQAYRQSQPHIPLYPKLQNHPLPALLLPWITPSCLFSTHPLGSMSAKLGQSGGPELWCHGTEAGFSLQALAHLCALMWLPTRMVQTCFYSMFATFLGQHKGLAPAQHNLWIAMCANINKVSNPARADQNNFAFGLLELWFF